MKRSFLFFVLALALSFGAAAQQGPSSERSQSVITVAGESFYVHTVRQGDTFYSLGKLYDTDEASIRSYNPHIADGLKAGQVIKIINRQEPEKQMNQRKLNKLFDVHVVNHGETAYSISKRYNIPLAVLMEDNQGFDPAHISIGQQVNIRKSERGTAGDAQIEAEMTSYRNALNSVSDRFEHHIVERGETLYSLSRSTGTPIDTITRYNPDIIREGLKQGAIVRLPVKVKEPVYTDAVNTQTLPQPEPVADRGMDFGGIKNIDVSKPVKVVLMLPLRGEGVSGGSSLDFYQGALIALEELKGMGVSAKVDLFNTGRSVSEVRSALDTRELQEADVIIGPVYDECFREVADFAARRGIVAVSPLTAVSGEGNGNVFQVSPRNETKNIKLKNELSPVNNVIVISSSNDDAELVRELTPLLPASAHRVAYSKSMQPTAIERLLSTDKDNVFVIFASNDATISEILARISSIHNNVIARSVKNPVIKIVGSSRWVNSSVIDKDLLFKLNMCYITSYHADRGDARVLDFDRRYIAAFSARPSRSSYRGYDVTKLFVGNIKMNGSQFHLYINNGSLSLLQTPYRFEQFVPGGKYENGEWAKVCFKNDFTIEVQ